MTELQSAKVSKKFGPTQDTLERWTKDMEKAWECIDT